MKRKIFLEKNKTIIFVLILSLSLCFSYCEQDKRIEGFTALESNIEYFEKIDPIFKLNYDLLKVEKKIKELGSSIIIDKNENNIRMFDVIQFGAFTRDERKKINIRQNINNIVKGHLTSPNYILKDCKSIQFLAMKKEKQLYIIGWKFILERKRGNSLIKAIEKEYGIAGDVHDAFGWKSKKIRYLYTLYRKAISFTVISETYLKKIFPDKISEN